MESEPRGTSKIGTSSKSASFMSSLPEVSGLTIAIVAAGCGILILCLLLVLIFFCCRNSRRAKGKGGAGCSSDDSENSSHQGVSTVDRKTGYMQNQQFNGSKLHHRQQQQQQHQPKQQLVMVSPHPSLTSTDETSVDQSTNGGRVFATLISANNPLTTGPHNNEGSDSDHSNGSLLLQPSLHRQPQQQQQQRKIIYEVVV